MKMIFFNNDTSMGQRKNSESLTGIEPMASQIPVSGIWEAMGSSPSGTQNFFFFVPCSCHC